MKYLLLFGVIFGSFTLVIAGLHIYSIESNQLRYKTCIKDAVNVIQLFPISLLKNPNNEEEIEEANTLFGEYLRTVENYCKKQ